MFFGQEACGILAPQPGMDHAPPALDGEVVFISSRSLFNISCFSQSLSPDYLSVTPSCFQDFGSLEAEVLTTGSPGKSPDSFLLWVIIGH